MGDFMGDGATKWCWCPRKVLGAELIVRCLKTGTTAEEDGTVFIGLAFLTVIFTDKLEFLSSFLTNLFRDLPIAIHQLVLAHFRRA